RMQRGQRGEQGARGLLVEHEALYGCEKDAGGHDRNAGPVNRVQRSLPERDYARAVERAGRVDGAEPELVSEIGEAFVGHADHAAVDARSNEEGRDRLGSWAVRRLRVAEGPCPVADAGKRGGLAARVEQHERRVGAAEVQLVDDAVA